MKQRTISKYKPIHDGKTVNNEAASRCPESNLKYLRKSRRGPEICNPLSRRNPFRLKLASPYGVVYNDTREGP